MSQALNWGIIGLGEIAAAFAENLKENGKNIYGVAARDEDRAVKFAEKHGIKQAYSSYDGLLSDQAIDIVYIASINSQHFQLIKQSLENGKHVLCEKAIWHDYGELLELEKLAKERKLILAEAMTIYHMPLMEKLKTLIAEGAIGKLQSVQADFGSLKEDDPTNRFFSKEKGGGAMLDIGIYALSFLSFFIEGKAAEIQEVQIPYSKTGVDERWNIGMVTDKDILATATLSFRSKLPKRALIAGDEGYIEIYEYPRADKAVLVKPDGSKETIAAGESRNALYYEASHMEEAIAKQDSGLVYFELTKQTIFWIDGLLSRHF
ncbi:Gfo/Idh/MocA family protein [Vagococcus elongatus]|nr:Gfo/Idh/MocA family oxidoreductase [Vagococcus elongatus]